MLFNSFEYLLIFLPATLAIYFAITCRARSATAKIWLVAASLGFYSWWGWVYLPLIMCSIVVNYGAGTALCSKSLSQPVRRGILFGGIALNLALLGYFKYANFVVDNLNGLSGTDIRLPSIALPLAISFFTFQKIAYLVDSFRSETVGYNFIDYSLFVTFFPQLIAGPIVHHKDVVPQFADKANLRPDDKNIATGLCILSIGLFKKVLISDSFAEYANLGFDSATTLNCLAAWVTSLSYTFQLYFDFSGYTDMAIGSALLFNIKLPMNFNSPYRSLDIQEFWRRWHITLSRFLRDYVYIPLGGNRRSETTTYLNLFLTFLIGGLWHGASWMFVIWGAMHGAAIVIHRLWSRYGVAMAGPLAWFLTFSFVNVTWIFFRARDMSSATRVLSGMTRVLDGSIGKLFEMQQRRATLFLIFAFVIVLTAKTTISFCTEGDERVSVVSGAALAISLIAMSFATAGASQFLYFNF